MQPPKDTTQVFSFYTGGNTFTRSQTVNRSQTSLFSLRGFVILPETFLQRGQSLFTQSLLCYTSFPKQAMYKIISHAGNLLQERDMYYLLEMHCSTILHHTHTHIPEALSASEQTCCVCCEGVGGCVDRAEVDTAETAHNTPLKFQ